MLSVLNIINAEKNRRSVGHTAEYQLSPDGHGNISGSHVPCLNQMCRGKQKKSIMAIYRILFIGNFIMLFLEHTV